MASKTPYANKYGEITDGSGRSGLTPLELLFPGRSTTSLNQREKQVYEDVEEIQRDILKRYTTRELLNTDAISTRSLKKSNLCNRRNPAFKKWEKTPNHNFERKDLYPIGDGQGDWKANNPVVDKLLEPVLVLASRILGNMYKSEWYAILIPVNVLLVETFRCPSREQVLIQE
jgi:hypothetical protein